MSWMKRNLIWLILSAILLFDGSFRVWVALSNDFGSDPAAHAMAAREIARTLQLKPYFPYFVTGQGTYYPIAYPQLFYVFLAFSYILGGEVGMKLVSPIFGTLTVLVVFFFVRKLFSSLTALIASFLLIGERHLFLVTAEAFMEGAVTFFSVVAAFEYLLYLKNREKKFFVLSIVSLGLLLATKQQGLLVAVILVIFTLIFTVKEIRVKKAGVFSAFKQNMGCAFLLIVVSLIIASPFLYYQISTTGTIDYPPANDLTKLFFQPKWVEDSASIKYVASRAGYQILPSQPFLFLLLIEYYNTIYVPFISFLIILGFALIILKKEHTDFLLLMASFLLVYLSIMLYMVLPWRYLVTLPVLSIIIAAIGASWILKKLASTDLGKFHLRSIFGVSFPKEKCKNVLIIGFVILFLILPTFADIQANYTKCYAGENWTTGGYWPDRLKKVKEAAEWLNKHTTMTDIILVDRWLEVGYYSERNVLCINEMGGHNLPKLYAASTPIEAIKYIREYNITYIWISQLQIDRSMYEWIPRHGLLDFIDFAPSYFEKVYQNDLIRIYRVLSSSEDFILKDKHYYANVFGDFDDLYDTSPIILGPADSWAMNSSYNIGRTLINNDGFIRIYINETDLTSHMDGDDGLYSNTPTTLVLYYWDTFTETVNVSLPMGHPKASSFYNITAQIYGTGDGKLKWKIMQIGDLPYQVSADDRGPLSRGYQVEFHLTTQAQFPLRMALLIPDSTNLTNEQCENWAAWLTEGGT